MAESSKPDADKNVQTQVTELKDLLVRYAHAVDTRDRPLFRELFTGDAVVDYAAFGEPRGSVEQVVAFLDPVLPLFTATQHLVAN